MKKGIAAVVIIVVVGVALAMVVGHKKTTDTSKTAQPTTPTTTQKETTPSTADSTANKSTTPAATTGTATTVSIDGFAYKEATVTIKKGTEVTWTNKDSAAHTVTFDDSSVSSSGNMPQNATYSHTFTTAGTFKYHCAYHPNMVATVVVTE